MKNRQQYVLPGGGMEAGETPQVCAERECREELGLRITAHNPVAIVREFYDGILRFEHLFLRADYDNQRRKPNRTEEEISLGITEEWIPLDAVQGQLLQTTAHVMPDETQKEYIHRAIANCHLRELLGIAAVLNWPWKSIVARGQNQKNISITAVKL
ncbi:MAG: NUDIX hydrolase [Sphaerochaetaceae bacterium]